MLMPMWIILVCMKRENSGRTPAVQKEKEQRGNLSCAACLQAVESRKAHPKQNKCGKHSKEIEAC